MTHCLLAICVLLGCHEARADGAPLASPDALTVQELPALAGVWTVKNPTPERLAVLHLRANGTGLWVTHRQTQLHDAPVQWRMADGQLLVWLEDSPAPMRASFVAGDAPNDDQLVLAIGEKPVGMIRTTEDRLLRLLPDHERPPEPADAAPSVVGVWASEARDGEEARSVLELCADGVGQWIAVHPQTPVGFRFRWSREDDKITLIPQGESGPKRLQLRVAADAMSLVVEGPDSGELRRSQDPQHLTLLHPPMPLPDPLPEAPNAQGQDLYYAKGATEAVIAFKHPEKIFEIGNENLAPAQVRDWLAALRESLRPRLDQIERPEFELSPDGKSLVVHGFRKTDSKSIAWIWWDWRKAEEIEELEVYFRGGGRFLSRRHVYLGDGGVLDRQTGKRYPEPPVDALSFDVADSGRWVGISEDGSKLRLGELDGRVDGKPYREVELDDPVAEWPELVWVNEGRHFLLEMRDQGVRLYTADGAVVDHIEGGVRRAAQVGDARVFVQASGNPLEAQVATVTADGRFELSEPITLRCRPDRASPSGRYVLGLGPRKTGDRFDVDRTERSDSDAPLPPRPKYGVRWLSWAPSAE
jgi:hypothetical protein